MPPNFSEHKVNFRGKIKNLHETAKSRKHDMILDSKYFQTILEKLSD